MGWDFIQKFAFLYMSLDVGAKMQLGLDFIQGSDFIPNQMPTWQYFRERVRAARRR